MSKKSKTAGKTAKSNVKSFTMNDITYTDGEDRVTIEITGQAFANLKEITEITNKWAEEDYTPSSVLRTFCLTDSFLRLNKKRPNDGMNYPVYQTLPGFVSEEFENGDELRSVFESAGFDASI